MDVPQRVSGLDQSLSISTVRARPWLRHGLSASFVAIAVAAILITWFCPWVWYGPRDWEQWNRIRTFRMPPDRVVYEEDLVRAKRLLALPKDPATAYVGDRGRTLRLYQANDNSDYRNSSSLDRRWAEYVPEFWLSLFVNSVPTLAFVHERSSSSGARLVLATARGSVDSPPRGKNQAKDGLLIGALSRSIRKPFVDSPRRFSYLRIPLRPDQVSRAYAGQVDPANDARFTIKYELDDVPGTVEGVLQPDDSVTLKVLDGPGVNNWQSIR